MKVFKAPKTPKSKKPYKVFLAGSIEMGVAEEWQETVTKHLDKFDIEIYNPRRDDWDSTWKQDPSEGTQFREQVDWELEHIVDSDLTVIYFDAETKSPISLLELGIVLGLDNEVLVYCPETFYRYGNVAVTMNFFGKQDKLYTDKEQWIAAIEEELKEMSTDLKEENTMIEVEYDENLNLHLEGHVEGESEELEVEEVVEEATTSIIYESTNVDLNNYIREKYNK